MLKPSSGRILIIDDEVFLVELAAKFLSLAGFEATGFSDPAAAVKWFETEHAHVDFVVIDMKMPQMNGEACFAELKRIDPGVKVAILSGFVEDSSAQELLRNGALKFFQKPLKYPDLVEWISGYLNRHSTARKEAAVLNECGDSLSKASQTGINRTEVDFSTLN